MAKIKNNIKENVNNNLKEASIKESEELQKQGWVVVDMKFIDGIKKHFLKKE